MSIRGNWSKADAIRLRMVDTCARNRRLVAVNRNMSDPIPIDLVRLRRSCADCSLSQLCLPAGVDREDLGRLDVMVERRRLFQRGESLFRAGDPLRSVYVTSDGAFKTVVVN